MGMSVEAYARQMKQLLPRGGLWKLELGSFLSRLFLGISEEFARIDARALVLQNEWDPRTASETLADWERVLGVSPTSEVDADRQAVITAAFIAQGGANAAYFISVAATLGFAVRISEPAANTWRMTVDYTNYVGPWDLVETLARVGTARVGDPLGTRRVVEFEDVFNRIKPAHTALYFAYV